MSLPDDRKSLTICTSFSTQYPLQHWRIHRHGQKWYSNSACWRVTMCVDRCAALNVWFSNVEEISFGRLRKTWAEVTCFDRAFHRHGPARRSVTGGWRTCIRRSELSTKQSEDALSGFTAGRLVQIVGKVSRCFFVRDDSEFELYPHRGLQCTAFVWERMEIDHRLEFGRRKTTGTMTSMTSRQGWWWWVVGRRGSNTSELLLVELPSIDVVRRQHSAAANQRFNREPSWRSFDFSHVFNRRSAR